MFVLVFFGILCIFPSWIFILGVLFLIFNIFGHNIFLGVPENLEAFREHAHGFFHINYDMFCEKIVNSFTTKNHNTTYKHTKKTYN